MSQQDAPSSQPLPPAQEDASTEPGGSGGSGASDVNNTTQASLELLQRLLDFTKGDVDQAEKLAQLLARLSPASPLSFLAPSSSGQGCQGCGPSTSTTVGVNSAAASAASTTGVAVATSVPNSSATATAVSPSLLTVGSTTSSTAVPFSEVSSIPSGVTLTIGAAGDVSYTGATESTNAQQTNTASVKLNNAAPEQQTQTVLSRVQNIPSQTQAQSGSQQHPQPPPPINTSVPSRDFPWQPQQRFPDEQQKPLHPPDEAEAATLNELGQSPIHKARIINIQKRPNSGTRSPTTESLLQRSASSFMRPLVAANMARQRPMSLGAVDTNIDRFLNMAAAQYGFTKFGSSGSQETVDYTLPTPPPSEQQYRHNSEQQREYQQQQQQQQYQQEQQQEQQQQPPPYSQPSTASSGQRTSDNDVEPQSQPQPQPRKQSQDTEDVASEIAELKEEIARLTQQCRAWERIASLSVNLASVEGDSKRASLVSSTGTGTGTGAAGGGGGVGGAMVV